MRLKIECSVAQSVEKVEEGFTQDLFLALNPPFPKVNLRRFDGCKTNDVVTIELNFILFKQIWESLITDYERNATTFRFVDEGTSLPFFLASWRHHHLVVAEGEGAKIIDDITFKTPWWLPAWLMYPALYFQFQYRKPIYRRYFKK